METPLTDLAEPMLLLDIIKQAKPVLSYNIAWDKFIGLATLHNIVPLVFYRLQKYNQYIPKDTYLYLKSSYLGNIATNLKFWNEFLIINETFRQRNISLLPLKGMDILARFYPAFDLRSMVDIDVLIKEGQFSAVEKALTDLGYQKNLLGLKEEYWRQHQCHIAFYKDKIMVEAHWGLDFKRGNRVILPHLWEKIIQVGAGNHKISILSPEDALFSFALHWRHFGNILSLKQVLDVARIIKESPTFDWDYVLKESSQGRVSAAIYFILMQACLFCEAEIPKDIFRKLEIPPWQKSLIKKFLLKHTFKTQPSLKKLYLKAHFLLYDNIFESILYLINIPYEQFAKFYDLKPYTKKTDLAYRLRFLYMLKSLYPKRN